MGFRFAFICFAVLPCQILRIMSDEQVFVNDIDGKRSKDQEAKEADRQRRQDDKDCVSKQHKDKDRKSSDADVAVSQDEVQAARDFAKKELEKAACDYQAMDELEAEAARAA